SSGSGRVGSSGSGCVGSSEAPGRLHRGLEWPELVPLSASSAIKSAAVEGELRRDGTPITGGGPKSGRVVVSPP
ncbi:MAG: hypothetical protein V5A43_11705, partial [Haloarculaceae archaeon]